MFITLLRLSVFGRKRCDSLDGRQTRKNSGNTDICLLTLRQARGNAGIISRGGMNRLDTYKLYVWYHTRGRGGKGRGKVLGNETTTVRYVVLAWSFIRTSIHPSIHPYSSVSRSPGRSLPR